MCSGPVPLGRLSHAFLPGHPLPECLCLSLGMLKALFEWLSLKDSGKKVSSGSQPHPDST